VCSLYITLIVSLNSVTQYGAIIKYKLKIFYTLIFGICKLIENKNNNNASVQTQSCYAATKNLHARTSLADLN
jgi:hypothetical protein